VAPQKRKFSLPFGLGMPKEKTARADGEKKLSPFAKFRKTIKNRSSPKASERASKKTEGKVVEPADESAYPELDM
jgi:hypothetical protein